MEYKAALYEMIDQHVEQANTGSRVAQKTYSPKINVPDEMVNSITKCLSDNVNSSIINDMSNNGSEDWQILAKISAQLKTVETEEELASVFLKEILYQTNGIYSVFYKYSLPQDEPIFWQGYPNPEIGKQLSLPNVQTLRQIVDTEQPYFFSNETWQSNHRRPTRKNGEVKSSYNSLVLPMMTSQGELIGILLVGLSQERMLTDEMVATLKSIVIMAADVLNRASIMNTLENLVAERTKELTAANERLLELDQLKTKFIQDISHEFRTPLTSIGLYLNLLEKESNGGGNRYIEALKRQTDQLTRLINAILDISNPERIRGRDTYEKIDLTKLLIDIAGVKESYAMTRGLKLTWQIDEPTAVYGNAESLQRLFANLIDNAISYTPEGSIGLTLTQTEGLACISITDTGIGIPKQELELIFDRFYRGVGISQLDIPGSGLGLSMVKQIAEEHEGRVEVESQPDEGTTFRVWLPIMS